ncbi:MAG: MurR/RpiR family transcriptional regulator, partial [Mesorhizobium sp.]
MQEKILARLRSSQPSLSPALLRISEYVLNDPAKVVNQTITEVADGSGSSEASVLRFCRDIKFSSFQRFKLALGIELST